MRARWWPVPLLPGPSSERQGERDPLKNSPKQFPESMVRLLACLPRIKWVQISLGEIAPTDYCRVVV